MDVSIIIVNYKTPRLVINCVNSIKEKCVGLNYEIIVVDNASEDQSVEILNEKLNEEIYLIKSDINLGFGRANNLGVKYAKGKYVFLLNSDTILINNAIKILYNYLEKMPEVGVVGGNLYSLDLKPNSSFSKSYDDLKSLRKQSSWMSIFNEILSRQFRQKFYNEEKKRKYIYRNTFNYSNDPMEVGYIFGTDMMVSRELYNQMNGFDPEFFMYFEEEELSWRIHQVGYKIVNVPMAKIIHLDGGTFKRDESFNSRQFMMRMTGAMTYYKKRFGHNGVEDFYYYKMLKLRRNHKLAKLLKRPMLLEATENQMSCLEEAYKKASAYRI